MTKAIFKKYNYEIYWNTKNYKKVMIKLYHTDCMDYMKDCKDNQFNLALVDPPYGIGPNWSKSRSDRFFKHGKLYQYNNKEIPTKDYFKQLFRISKNQIIWGGNYFTEYLYSTNSWIIWNKFRNADTTFMSEAELAWTSFKKVMRIANFQWDGAKKCEKVNKIHPHQKPVKLYKWQLEKYAKKGDKILDTHSGSFSSAIAAYDMGFDFTGCEIDVGYFNAGLKRFDQFKAQTKLF